MVLLGFLIGADASEMACLPFFLYLVGNYKGMGGKCVRGGTEGVLGWLWVCCWWWKVPDVAGMGGNGFGTRACVHHIVCGCGVVAHGA